MEAHSNTENAIKELRQRQLFFMKSCKYLMEHPSDKIREDAYLIMCDLLICFSKVRRAFDIRFNRKAVDVLRSGFISILNLNLSGAFVFLPATWGTGTAFATSGLRYG